MRENLGDLGEATLSQLIAQVGIANKSGTDKAGWDFIFDEYPLFGRAAIPDSPLDKMPSPLKCQIQVKSTDKKFERQQIKLSNCVRYARSGDPVFILVLEFDGKNDCQRAFLIHVGQDYISRILHRLREVPTEAFYKLHKMTVDFTYSADDMLPALSGEGLKQAILKHVGERPEEYSKTKLAFVESVGYDQPTGKLTVHLPMANGKEVLVDWIIGDTPELEFIGGTIRQDIRFGIPGKTEYIGRGKLAINFQPVGRGTIKLTTPAGKSMEIDANVIMPSFEIAKPDEPEFKIRFCALSFDILIKPVTGYAQCGITLPDPDVDIPLKDLHKAANPLMFFARAKDQFGNCGLELYYRDDFIGRAAVDFGEALETDILQYAMAIESAWRIAKYFDLHDDIIVKPMELIIQHAMLLGTSAWLHNENISLKMTFYVDKLLDDGKITTSPIIRRFPIGQYRITIGLMVSGKAKLTGNFRKNQVEYELSVDKPDIFRAETELRKEVTRFTNASFLGDIIEQYKNEDTNLITFQDTD